MHKVDKGRAEFAAEDPQTPTSGCLEDPNAELTRLFVDVVQKARANAGQTPVRRAVFLKQHGGAFGYFKVAADLPDDLRVGVLSHRQFPVWVRFSSDTTPDQPDYKKTLGIGIKLFGVPGRKLLERERNALTHDFLLQNHDVFFVDDARSMCEFTWFGLEGPGYAAYLAQHPETKRILDDMAKAERSALTTNYWSCLPYALGAGRYVKYLLRPLAEQASPPAEAPEDPNYLRVDLKERLAQTGARFAFFIQLQSNAEDMPLDKATVRWDEDVSRPMLAAHIDLPAGQDIDAPGTDDYCRNLSFTPWHALPEHTPVGSIAEARRVAYEASASFRRERNGVPVVEPIEPFWPMETTGKAT